MFSRGDFYAKTVLPYRKSVKKTSGVEKKNSAHYFSTFVNYNTYISK